MGADVLKAAVANTAIGRNTHHVAFSLRWGGRDAIHVFAQSALRVAAAARGAEARPPGRAFFLPLVRLPVPSLYLIRTHLQSAGSISGLGPRLFLLDLGGRRKRSSHPLARQSTGSSDVFNSVSIGFQSFLWYQALAKQEIGEEICHGPYSQPRLPKHLT